MVRGGLAIFVFSFADDLFTFLTVLYRIIAEYPIVGQASPK